MCVFLETMRKIVICAKCSDLCNVEYYKDGELQVESDGYAPDLKGICKGDYIDISIDLDTGKILEYSPIPHEDVMDELTDGEWDEDEEEDEPDVFDENGRNVDPHAINQVDPNAIDSSVNEFFDKYDFL